MAWSKATNPWGEEGWESWYLPQSAYTCTMHTASYWGADDTLQIHKLVSSAAMCLTLPFSSCFCKRQVAYKCSQPSLCLRCKNSTAQTSGHAQRHPASRSTLLSWPAECSCSNQDNLFTRQYLALCSLWRRGMSFSSEGPLRKEVGFIRQITHPLFQNKQLSFTLVYIWCNYSESVENTDTSTMWPWFVVPTKFQPHFVIKVSTRSINHYQIYNIINIYIYI